MLNQPYLALVYQVPLLPSDPDISFWVYQTLSSFLMPTDCRINNLFEV